VLEKQKRNNIFRATCIQKKSKHKKGTNENTACMQKRRGGRQKRKTKKEQVRRLARVPTNIPGSGSIDSEEKANSRRAPARTIPNRRSDVFCPPQRHAHSQSRNTAHTTTTRPGRDEGTKGTHEDANTSA
jgi:hypothetical protein